MSARGGEDALGGQRGGEQFGVGQEPVSETMAKEERHGRGAASGARALQPAPQDEVDFIGRQHPDGCLPARQAATGAHLLGDTALAEIRAEGDDAGDALGLGLGVDQGAECTDRNAHEPDVAVAARSGRRDAVGLQAVDDRPVAVVAEVRVDQQRVDGLLALAHRLHKAFAHELFGPGE